MSTICSWLRAEYPGLAAPAQVACRRAASPHGGEVTSWPSLLRVLCALAYEPDSPDALRRLGCFPFGGEPVTADLLQRLWGSARLLLSLPGGPGWSDDDRNAAEQVKKRLLEALHECRSFPWTLYIGSHNLFRGPTALIMEATIGSAMQKAWEGCDQLLPLSRTRALCHPAWPMTGRISSLSGSRLTRSKPSSG